MRKPEQVLSWNRIPRVTPGRILRLTNRHDFLPSLNEGETCLAHGNGRSYGDVCLNEGGLLLKTRGLDRFIHFDRTTGVLACEAGVLLGEILDVVTQQGWFLPVTPGTRFATVGGAIANDVHGKNHHVAGSFGHHVVRFELLRSDGQRLICSANANADMFAATIGGLGMTGLITWAELRLAPVASAFMTTQAQRFRSLDEFWSASALAEEVWPYTVAWLDCTSKRGRGVLYCGSHASPQSSTSEPQEKGRSMPFDPPISLINTLSLRAFNIAYYHRPINDRRRIQHYRSYFYPLDAIQNWNRIYGSRGFHQYQCVIPPDHARAGIGALVKQVADSSIGSFLAVLKVFGPKPSLGLLSFPRAGATLALDFPESGDRTKQLFASLDDIVREHGGALYPAKDARMSGAMFRRGYPQHEKFLPFVDPKISSGFWRRVMEN